MLSAARHWVRIAVCRGAGSVRGSAGRSWSLPGLFSFSDYSSRLQRCLSSGQSPVCANCI